MGNTSTPTAPHVYVAIAEITEAIGAAGIAKARKNEQQKYQFRGIDDVYNALSPILAKHSLCIIPRVMNREVVERKSNSGGALFSVSLHVAFDLVSAIDGSKHEAITYGEAMDSGDKATNKAMSAAYKYLAMQLFCIPTEGDNDADATTHTVTAEAMATDEQVAQLQDYHIVEGLTPAARKKIGELLSLARRNALPYARAEAALTTLKEKLNG